MGPARSEKDVCSVGQQVCCVQGCAYAPGRLYPTTRAKPPPRGRKCQAELLPLSDETWEHSAFVSTLSPAEDCSAVWLHRWY